VVVTISAEREPKLWLWQLIVPEIVEHDFCWDAISAGTLFLLGRYFCWEALFGWHAFSARTRLLAGKGK
jgi:hypothetical protein